MHKPLLAFARLLVPSLLAWSAAAQCVPVVPPTGLPGFDVPPDTMVEWDPDGAGPKGLHWVFGGKFEVAGDILAKGVALLDPATGQWSTLGSGLAGVRRFLPLPNGQLLATAGLWPWLWNGTQWQQLPGAPSQNHVINAMVLMPNGDLVVGGGVASVGAYLARWNGSTWAPLGAGVSGNIGLVLNYGSMVEDLLVDGAGDLWVGGAFTTAGSVAARNIARWDGATWHAVGGGLQESIVLWPGVKRLVRMPQGDIVAVGKINKAGVTPVNGVARWDGSVWQAMAGGVWHSASSGLQPQSIGVALDTNGDLWVAGLTLVRWDGVAWNGLPSGTGPDGTVRACMATSSGALVVSGSFRTVQPVGRADAVAALDNGTWSRLPGPTNGVAWDANSLFGSVAGDVVAIRSFPSESLVRSSAGWGPLAGTPVLPNVSTVCNLANGDLVVGARMAWTVAGQPAGPLLRYDGVTWSPLGGQGLVANPYGALSLNCSLPTADGGLIVGGAFSRIGGVLAAGIARWDGTTWQKFGLGVNGEARCLLQLPDGDLVVGGSFLSAGGVLSYNVARWNGTSWAAMGSGIGGSPNTFVDDLILLPNGDLLATTTSDVAPPVVRWDGTAWVDATAGQSFQVRDAILLPSREVLLAVHLANPVPSLAEPRLLIGDGLSPWRDFAVQPTNSNTTMPFRLHLTSSGELLVQGPFGGMGGMPASGLASILPGCPAVVNVVGSGCAGSNGQDTLTSEALPWLGGIARARATGLPNEALAVVTLGLTSPNVPLASLSPLALPGCFVRTSLDFYVFANVSGGAMPIDLPLPLLPALVGASLFEQVLSLGLTSGAPFEATSTNALELQLGLFGG